MLQDLIVSRKPSILLKEVIIAWGKGSSGVSLDYAFTGNSCFDGIYWAGSVFLSSLTWSRAENGTGDKANCEHKENLKHSPCARGRAED